MWEDRNCDDDDETGGLTDLIPRFSRERTCRGPSEQNLGERDSDGNYEIGVDHSAGDWGIYNSAVRAPNKEHGRREPTGWVKVVDGVWWDKKPAMQMRYSTEYSTP